MARISGEQLLVSKLKKIADAVRKRLNVTRELTLDEMAQDIDTKVGGGIIDNSASYVYDGGATSVASWKFILNSQIRSVDFPNATYIGGAAFAHCYNLSHVSMPNATTLAVGAFKYCVNLREIDLPNLTSVILPSGIEYDHASYTKVSYLGYVYWDDRTFSDCSNVSLISLPKLSYIEDLGWIFSHLGTQPDEVYLPNLMLWSRGNLIVSTGSFSRGFSQKFGGRKLTLGASSFPTIPIGDGGYGIEELYLPNWSGNFYTGLGGLVSARIIFAPKAHGHQSANFGSCQALTIGEPGALGWYYGKNTLKTVTFTEAVVLWSGYSTATNYQSWCTFTKLQSVYAPRASVISSWALQKCKSLTTLSVPMLNVISHGALNGCTALRTLSLPEIQDIYPSVFSGCTNLKSLYLGYAVPRIFSNTFDNSPFKSPTGGTYGSIYVPSTVYPNYLANSLWASLSARIVSYTP